MSKRGWTADQHLGSDEVIKYCDRPFRDAAHMNKRLIDGANSRVKPDDTGVVVGDFCWKSGPSRFRAYRQQLQGNWVFLKGNHDSNNGVKTVGSSMFTRISHFNVFVNHIPYFYKDWFDADLIAYVEKSCDFAICGHVHEKWKSFYKEESVYGYANIPTINVGVDQWNYMPVMDDELANYFIKLRNKR